MKKFLLKSLLSTLILGTSWQAYAMEGAGGFKPNDKLVARGRYVVKTTGCNDCHTPGYGANNGNVPESQWLTGVLLGYRGPWGTSYPVNLRHLMTTMSEAEWVHFAKTFTALPPMPWYNVHAMTTEDQRAIYHFIRYLGDNNTEIPEPLAPGVTPTTPYINFVPVMPGT